MISIFHFFCFVLPYVLCLKEYTTNLYRFWVFIFLAIVIKLDKDILSHKTSLVNSIALGWACFIIKILFSFSYYCNVNFSVRTKLIADDLTLPNSFIIFYLSLRVNEKAPCWLKEFLDFFLYPKTLADVSYHIMSIYLKYDDWKTLQHWEIHIC